MEKKYILTDGTNYIKVDGKERYPMLVICELFATRFDLLNANFYINTNKMKNFSLDNGRSFYPKEVENLPEFKNDVDSDNAKYLVADGEHYLQLTESGSYVITQERKQAHQFIKRKAINVLNSIPKRLEGYRWEIKKYSLYPIPKQELEKTYDNIINETLNNMSNWEECIVKLKDYLDEINNKITLIYNELIDIEHAAEFFNLNMYDGWKLYKNLQDARKRRRKLKDEKIVIEYILNSNFKDCSKKSIDSLIKRLDERTYYPRVLQELFDK